MGRRTRETYLDGVSILLRLPPRIPILTEEEINTTLDMWLAKCPAPSSATPLPEQAE